MKRKFNPPQPTGEKKTIPNNDWKMKVDNSHHAADFIAKVYKFGRLPEDGIEPYLAKRDLQKNYKVFSKIGAGKFGKAYLVGINDSAIKYVAKLQKLDTVVLKQSYLNELSIMIELQNRTIHVPKIYDFFISNNWGVIVMENLENPPSWSSLTETEKQNREKRELDALNELYRLGVVHYDSHRNNIMYRNSYQTGDVILIDFGMSVHLGQKYRFPLSGTGYHLEKYDKFDKKYNYRMHKQGIYNHERNFHVPNRNDYPFFFSELPDNIKEACSKLRQNIYEKQLKLGDGNYGATFKICDVRIANNRRCKLVLKSQKLKPEFEAEVDCMVE